MNTKEQLLNILLLHCGTEGCELQSGLRDLLTDLRHIAHDKKLHWLEAICGSRAVFEEEATAHIPVSTTKRYYAVKLSSTWRMHKSYSAKESCIACFGIPLRSDMAWKDLGTTKSEAERRLRKL